MPETEFTHEQVSVFLTSWQLTIKGLFFVNGGALVAILALIGNLISVQNPVSGLLITSIIEPTKMFCLSLFLTVLLSLVVSLKGDLEITGAHPRIDKYLHTILSISAFVVMIFVFYYLYQGIFSAIHILEVIR